MDMNENPSLFDEFMPHGMCYMWRKDILLLNVVSDVLIAIAYFSIPIFLYYFFRNRSTMPFRGIILMFSFFIFSCGVTHVLGVWTVWNGNYGVQGLGKAVTAAISIATALMLIPAMPKFMALRSPLELEEANDALEIEVQQRQKSEIERRTLEEQSRKLEQEIAHFGRINTMGQMATGLAHELNQPLTAIMQNADAALIEVSQPNFNREEMVDILQDLEAQAFRAGGIIKALRQFVRKDDGIVIKFDLNQLIEQSIRLFDADRSKKNIQIEFCADDLPEITGARVQIAQLIVNLIQNASHALVNTGIDSPTIIVTSSLNEDNVTVTIEDNGPGISEELDVYMPFVSTKPDGLGMGLSICRTIVDMHDGTIWHDKNTNLTTRFGFTLPLDEKSQDL